MGFLHLDQTEVKDDNMFQRLFWPSDHAGETDYLGKQGFRVCAGIAVLSLIVSTAQHQPIIGLLTFVFFVLGGIGVREHSTAAATLVAVVYIINLAASAAIGRFPGVITLGATALLLANVRGTWIAARWARSGDPEAMPERRNETFTDRLVDQMPLRVWPFARIPFFFLGGVYLMLTVVGTLILLTRPAIR